MSITEQALESYVPTPTTTPEGRLFLLKTLITAADVVVDDPFVVLADTLNLDDSNWVKTARKRTAGIEKELHEGGTLQVNFGTYFAAHLTVLGTAGEALHRDNRTTLTQVGEEQTKLYIPGSAVSKIRARVYGSPVYDENANKMTTVIHKMVDMQIKTSSDKPTIRYAQNRFGKDKSVVRDESLGKWFTFPLDIVQLAIV